MTREVWPAKEVAEAAKDVVCLAVYRWRRDDGASTPSPKDDEKKGGTTDSDWAIRLDVKAYPQIRLLDGWGRPLRSSDTYTMARSVAQVVAAMGAAKSEGRRASKPDATKPPAKLVERLPADDRAKATDPVGSVRARMWLRALGKGSWTDPDLVALFRADDDALLRYRLLQRLGGDTVADAAIDAAAEAVDGPNDYVRGEALRLLGKAGRGRAVEVLGAAIDKAVGGRSGWKNPNNVLCEAVEASIGTPDKALVGPLSKVIDTQDANNFATVLAVRSLVAIGRKEGKDAVRAPLEKARKLAGANAKTIEKEVAGFLGK